MAQIDPNIDVELVEVGPRDGLQNLPVPTPNAIKVELIQRLIDAGYTHLEIGSFVSPKAIPQMADMADLVAQAGPFDGVTAEVLVPNTRGARLALAAGIRDLIFVVSVSDSHNHSNVRRSRAASIADFRAMLAEIDPTADLSLRIGLATSFDCPFEGTTPDKAVMDTIEQLLNIRQGLKFNLSDTTGMALPDHVTRLAHQALTAFGKDARFGFHGHDTSGFGVANVLAAMDGGIRSFDGSIAGLGGCPFAPGATGNTASEDIVYMLERLGVPTGIDLEKLLETADFAAAIAGAQSGGHIRKLPRERALGGTIKQSAFA